jgi:peptidyl-prolyl cis-trans isomerase D
MLHSLRNAAQTWYIKVLFLILILSFGLWGVGDMVSGMVRVSGAIEVGGTSYSPQFVADNFKSDVEKMKRYGVNLSTTQAKQMGLLDATISRMATEAVMSEGAQDLPVGASDEALRAAIQQDPNFINNEGKFDIARFKQILSLNNIAEQNYLDSVRNSLTRDQMVAALTAAVTTPDVMVKSLQSFNLQQRTANVVAIPIDASAITATPAEDDLQNLYNEYGMTTFRVDETRDFDVLFLNADTIKPRITITDDEIAQRYEEDKNTLKHAEKRVVRQVLFSNKEDAARAYALIGGAGSLDAAISTAFAGKKVLSMGTVEKSALPPAVGDVVFALPHPTADAPSVSEPTQGDFGWHIFEVTAVIPEGTPALADVADTLKDILINEKATEEVRSISVQLDDEIGGGASLAEAAKTLSLPAPQKYAGVFASGQRADGTTTELDSKILKTVFETESGQPSLLEETNTGYYVVFVSAIDEAHPQPMEEVRDALVKMWRTNAAREKAFETADALATALKDGKAIADVAAQYNLTVQNTGPLARTSAATSVVPDALLTEIFAIDRIQGVAQANTGDDIRVAQLAAIHRIPAETASQEYDTLAKQLTNDLSGDILAQFANALGAENGLTINREAIYAAVP